MNYNLTIIERMILETLQISNKSKKEIILKTSIEEEMLQQVLKSLLAKNLVRLEDGLYAISKEHNDYIIKEINNSLSLLCEVQEIINSCIRQKLDAHSNRSFKLKKVNLNDRDEKIYNGLIYNLESFLNSLTKSDDVRSQKIIFWGEGKYEDIKNNIVGF